MELSAVRSGRSTSLSLDPPSSGRGKYQSRSRSSVGVDAKDGEGVTYTIWLSEEFLAGGGDTGTSSSRLREEKDEKVSNVGSWLGEQAVDTAPIGLVAARVEK